MPFPARRRAAPPPRARCFVSALFAAFGAFACSDPAPPVPRFDSPRPAGALEIRLDFAGEADLDLFVTDPRDEALYFGNNPSLGGGELDLDRRCDAEVPRRERARFVTPRAGRYRVGVSYDRSCHFRSVEAPFRIEVEANGLTLEHRGRVAPGDFEHIAFEFDFDPSRSEDGQPSPAAAIRSSTPESSARAARP